MLFSGKTSSQLLFLDEFLGQRRSWAGSLCKQSCLRAVGRKRAVPQGGYRNLSKLGFEESAYVIQTLLERSTEKPEQQCACITRRHETGIRVCH